MGPTDLELSITRLVTSHVLEAAAVAEESYVDIVPWGPLVPSNPKVSWSIQSPFKVSGHWPRQHSTQPHVGLALTKGSFCCAHSNPHVCVNRIVQELIKY